MRIAVIGAGIIGVTTAFELASDGHAVTVFERRSAAAEEGSFATSAIMAPGLVAPQGGTQHASGWARQLLAPREGLRLRWPLAGADWRWLSRSRRARRAPGDSLTGACLRELAFYSRARLQSLRTQLALEYDRSEGVLLVFRSDRDRRTAQTHLQQLSASGIPFGQLDAEQARRMEPALSGETPLAGAVLLPDDEVGNCRQFALLLKGIVQQSGVQFHFQASVQQITTAAQPTLRVQGEVQTRAFDAIVVCAGAASAALLAPLGLRLPLATLHAYSLSAAMREPLNAPRSAVIDAHHQVGISRLGQRIRVSGCAELGGDPATKHASAIQTLYQVLHDWFPGAAQKDATVQEWKGAFCAMPDGLPLVGPGKSPGLWMNLGHGTNGWSLACGAARLLADQISGHAPALDARTFGLARAPAGRKA